jgi:hypothetical protein
MSVKIMICSIPTIASALGCIRRVCIRSSPRLPLLVNLAHTVISCTQYTWQTALLWQMALLNSRQGRLA